MHRVQLLETGVLLVFGALAMLFTVQGGRLLLGTQSYSARATLTPNTDVGIFVAQAIGDRGPAIDESYLTALTLRSPEFLFREIDNRNLARFPPLDGRWISVGRVGAQEVYSRLSRAIAAKVTPDSNLSVTISGSDPRVAAQLLSIIVADLREYLRVQTMAELQRKSALLEGTAVLRVGAMAPSGDSAAVQTLTRQIELVRAAPDFAFSVQHEPLTVSEGAGLRWLSATTLAMLMILTIAVIGRRAGWLSDSRFIAGSSRGAGIHRVA